MLRGKTAVVTGGSRGIGRAVALEMARAGADIAILFSGEAGPGEQVCEEARALGVKAVQYRCDVSDFRAVKDTVLEIDRSLGGIDVLVNNAGITRDKLVPQMKEEDFDRVMDVNLKGAFNMIRHTYMGFAKKRSGRIINISSVAGMIGNSGQANYAAAKSGMIGLTKTVARELAGRNVTCNAIAPGFIDTAMTGALPAETIRLALESVPMKRMGKPGDIAHMAVFLASDLAEYVTGQVICVDGGMCM